MSLSWFCFLKAMTELIIRASSIGGCFRAVVYALQSRKAAKYSQETLLTFAIGRALEPVILEHAGYDLRRHWFNDLLESRVEVQPGLVILGHPDGADDDGWILEAKTMRAYSWEKSKENSIKTQHPQYIHQLAAYVFGRQAPGGIFLALNKDESKILVERHSLAELEPFHQNNLQRALLAFKLRQETRLPAKDKSLPGWACRTKYCVWQFCVHHEKSQKKARFFMRKNLQKRV
jgi:hypothetical protein